MECSVSEIKDDTKEVVLLSKAFEEVCPTYMLYGMSYDDFWYSDCFKTIYYRKAHKEELREKDEFMWEQGMYIYEAILDCAPILHPFSKAKKPQPYTDKPHLMQVFEDKKEKEEREKQEAENERIKAYMWVKNLQKIYKNNGGE